MGCPATWWALWKALRGSGISVGPSETVDAGRVMATLGLGDREVLREGIACAVLRRPDHRDTYDAMFDLWFPAALGARAVITTEDESAGSGVCRPMMSRLCGSCCWICWPTTKTWPARTSGWWR